MTERGAVVVSLDLERAERDSEGRAHPGHPRPVYPWVRGDWFRALPTGDASHCPEWYGRDLVEMIRRARPLQEIGCHTFSHVIMGDPGCDQRVAKAELARSVELARAEGINLKTMVFPRNKVGHLSVLRDAGFEVFRGPDIEPLSWLPNSLQHGANIVARVLSVPPAPVRPRRTAEGLIDLPGSMFYMAATEWQRFVPMGIRTVVVKRGLREAARQRAIFHLRLHPEGLVFGADRLFAGLQDIFEEAKRLQRAGVLQILPVYDAAVQYLGHDRNVPQ